MYLNYPTYCRSLINQLRALKLNKKRLNKCHGWSGWPSGLRRCVQVAVCSCRRGFESHFWFYHFIFPSRCFIWQNQTEIIDNWPANTKRVWRVKECTPHRNLIPKVIPFKLFLDHTQLRKSKKCPENLMTQFLLIWIFQVALHTFSPSTKTTNAVFMYLPGDHSPIKRYKEKDHLGRRVLANWSDFYIRC